MLLEAGAGLGCGYGDESGSGDDCGGQGPHSLLVNLQ
jgi:hypothetical protein